MEKENKEAWELLLESLDNQQNEIVRLQEREIQLLKQVMTLESKNRALIKTFSENKFKDKKQEIPKPDEK